MRVLVVDDHEVVRRGVSSLIKSQPNYEVCGEAVDGQDAVEKARALTPDVIVMDVSMPRLNGLEATHVIRATLPGSEVLILSQHDSPEMVRQAFKAGALGYVVKSSIARDLVEALESVSRHKPFFDRAISQRERPGNIDSQEILQRSATLETALHESEELYRSTFELAAVGVAHVNPDGRFLRVNDKLCAITGYSKEELLKLTFQDITHPEDVGEDVDQGGRVKAGELETYSMEKRYIRKNGTIIWVHLTVSGARDASGEIKHFISVVEDISARREGEEARARLAAIVESSDDAIVSKDLNGIIASWNGGAQRIFGYAPEEAIGRPITIIIPAELRGEEKQIIKRLRNGERIEHYETVRVNKSGQRLNISLTVSPVRDSSGKIIGASKVARDVTEQKRIEEAEEARQTSEARLELALEASKAAFFEWDLERKRGKWNSEMRAIYDFTPAGEEITDGEWLSLFHPDDVSRLREEAGKFYQSQDEFQFEFRAVRPGRPLRWMLSRGRIVRDATGKAVRMIGIHADITQRKLAEEALHREEARLRAAFTQTYSFLVLLSLDGTILEVNEAALRAAGQEREEILGRKFWEPWWAPLPDEVEILKNSVSRSAAGEIVQEECYFCLPDGSRRFAHRTLTPVRDDDGNVTIIVATGLDLTDQKEMRDELEGRVQRRTQELEEKNLALLQQTETVRELSGRLLRAQDEERRRIARDLHDSSGQILVAVQLNLTPLEERARELGPEFAEGIRQSLELVEQLSKELRTVSYLLHPPLLDEVGLPAALRWYVEGYSERSKIDVQLEVPPDLGRLPSDMEMTVFRIVQEGLTNIHRHSGGKQASIRLMRSAEEVCLEVRDNGQGMPASNGRLSARPVRAGVGIQGMRERVKQLGGRFEIQSSENGTAVNVSLPLTAAVSE
jgi:PAS domain S-box-containing protein